MIYFCPKIYSNKANNNTIRDNSPFSCVVSHPWHQIRNKFEPLNHEDIDLQERSIVGQLVNCASERLDQDGTCGFRAEKKYFSGGLKGPAGAAHLWPDSV